MKHIILDLDNCISDDGWRVKLIDHSKTGREKHTAYHQACGADKFCNQDLLRVYPIIIFTSRPKACESMTTAWLRSHDIHPEIMMMRPEGNEDSDVDLKRGFLKEILIDYEDIECAYDDRPDVVAMYRLQGLKAEVLAIHDDKKASFEQAMSRFDNLDKDDTLDDIRKRTLLIFDEMKQTYQERGKVYGPNFLMVGEVMRSFYPDGIKLKTAHDFVVWHLFELLIVKLTRFSNSQLSHVDSIHDVAIYAVMIEGLIVNDQRPIGEIPK